MPTIKTLTLRASAAALALGLAGGLAAPATPAFAGQTSDHVYSIDLSQDGISGFVTIQNVSANKHVNAVKIEPTKPSFSLSMAGWVSCEKPPAFADSILHAGGTKMYFGTLGLGHEQVWEQQVLHEAAYLPSYAEWDRPSPISAANKQTHSVNQADFVVPLSKVKNGPADLRFDPVALFNQKLQQHVNGGGDAVEFLRKDHSFSVERPISLGATCMFQYNNPNKNTVGGAWATVMVPLTVQYKGDPAINDTPMLNAQIANSVPAGGFKAGPQILVIQSMKFQPNLPHHTGACPASTKIRVFYQGHGKGAVQIIVADGNNIIANTGIKAFDGADGQQFFDFNIEVPKATLSQLNKTVNHTLKASVRTRDTGPSWDTPYKEMATVVWKHRCTPQVNPALGGTVGGAGGSVKQNQPQPAVPVIKRAQ